MIKVNMAKLTGPLFSLTASGELGKAIQFVCGQFLRSKPDVPIGSTESQQVQRAKFLAGASKWSNDLSEATKDNWNNFRNVIVTKDKCVEMGYQTSGYNLWQLYWLKFGESGWTNYPDPPV